MKKQKYHPEKNVLKPPAFPPLSLAGGPYYITGVNRAVTAPKLNGKGDDACWQSAAQLKCDIYKKTEDLNLRENNTLNISGKADNYILVAEFTNTLLDKSFSNGNATLKDVFGEVTLNSVNLENKGGGVNFSITVEFTPQKLKEVL